MRSITLDGMKEIKISMRAQRALEPMMASHISQRLSARSTLAKRLTSVSIGARELVAISVGRAEAVGIHLGESTLRNRNDSKRDTHDGEKAGADVVAESCKWTWYIH